MYSYFIYHEEGDDLTLFKCWQALHPGKRVTRHKKINNVKILEQGKQ
jgi:hypothetical protein